MTQHIFESMGYGCQIDCAVEPTRLSIKAPLKVDPS